jgi:hypothetical protein
VPNSWRWDAFLLGSIFCHGCISVKGSTSVMDAFLSRVQLLSGDTFIKDWDWGSGVANSMGFLQFLMYGSRSPIDSSNSPPSEKWVGLIN